MTDKLRKLIVETQSAFKADASRAKAKFESHSTLQEGLRSEVSMRNHSLVIDEPEALGGTDAGPNPVELILASLGTCQEITYRAYATAMGIPLDSVSVKLEGDIDLRGFFAVDETVRAGYQAIRGTVYIQSRATEEQLKQLRDVVNAHCPVLDIITKPVPVKLEMEVTSAPATATG